jgi:GxxExxY protein
MEDDITYKIIGCAIEVQRTLGGPGLLESIYQAALQHELVWQGLNVKPQMPVPVLYKGTKIKDALCLDMLVEDKIVVEVKSAEHDNPVFHKQLLTYLRLTGYKLGLLINFGKSPLTEGIRRIAN